MKPVDQRSPPRQSAPATAKPNFPPSVAHRTHLSPAAPTQNPSRPALHPAKTQNENCCQPVISVDTKKKELIGPFTNGGSDDRPKGSPEAVNVHDFADKTLGKVAPYGIYDPLDNHGWVSLGIDHDTAEFAVNAIRTWHERI